MNYFYSNRTNTVFVQPKQIMTLPISWYTNIRIFYHGFGPEAFEGRHIRIVDIADTTVLKLIYVGKKEMLTS